MTTDRYPTAAEMAVLVALKEHHYLTVEQVLLLTNRRSLRASQQQLTDLARAGYIRKHDRRSSNVLKPLRAAWSLTDKSKTYLEGAGMVVLTPHQPRPYTLDHLLAVNDVLISGRLLARQYPDIVELLEIQHDRELRTWQPKLTVVPDGFLHFALTTESGRVGFPIFLEVDMGTMDRRRWQEKISRYLRFLENDLPHVFGTDAATIAVAARTEQKRVTDLREWTEQELTRQNAADLGHLFYFSQLPVEISPADFFTTARWLLPFSTTPDSLLPGN
jgi:Replication-relaxation